MKAVPYRKQRAHAFTFIEIIVVITIVGLLAAIAVPRFIQARETSRLNVVYRNLRTLETAKEQWALEHRKPTGEPVPNVTILSNYIHDGVIHDVVNEQYIPNPVGTPSQADLPGGVRLGPWPPGSSIPAP
jgi:prepilin-type N-terminal cleavage/methylation domain-containing protein